MAKPSPPESLAHILEAIRQIENNTTGLTLEDVKKDRFRQLGIESCLEIVSEASRYGDSVKGALAVFSGDEHRPHNLKWRLHSLNAASRLHQYDQ